MMKEFSVKKSLELFDKSLQYLPAGVSSNARLMNTVCPAYAACTVFVDHAHGSHLWDVDGNEYIDYRLGYGPVILGHSYRPVHTAIHRADMKGLVFALGNELEITVAKKIASVVPTAELTRFANSGTEATMAAIRIARGYTKKEKIVKFEGHYHGAHDYLLYSTDPPFAAPENVPYPESLGIPKGMTKYILVEEWNNFVSLEKTVREHHDEIAAIITEPIMGNAGAIMPKEGYLQHLKELCDTYDMLLIFDEVKTGFRVSLGGAQEYFKVKPHISTFAKSLGNGYPIAAICGLRDIMNVVGPKKVLQGGTYSSNPVSLTAASATLDIMKKKHVHEWIIRYGKKMMKGIQEIMADQRIDGIIQGHPAMFQFLFTKKKAVYNYRDLAYCDMEFYAKLHYELLKRGVFIDEDNEEVIFSSYAHTQKDLEVTLTAFQEALHAAQAGRSILTQQPPSQDPVAIAIDAAKKLWRKIS